MFFPRSWYPVCRSKDLAPGSVISCKAFGRKLAVFRDQNKCIGVLDARCCHIGADLSRGTVKDNLLVCPLHNWSFDVHGQCKNIPCKERIPRRAKQTSLHSKEHYGVVFAYLGQTPDFQLPFFPNTHQSISSIARIIDFDSPYEMAGANSFDEQHLAAVHRRHVIGRQAITSLSPFHFSIEYRARVTPHTLYDKFLHAMGKEQVHMSLDCWGGNLLLFKHIGTANQMMISLLPVSDKCSRAFICTVLPRPDRIHQLVFNWLAVRLLNRFTMLFVGQDIKALQDIEFKFNNMLPEADATMIKWYQYWKRLPRMEFDRKPKEKESAPVKYNDAVDKELVVL